MWSRFSRPSCAHAGSPGGSAGYKSACNVGDLGLIPVLGRSPGEGNGQSLRYFCLENSIDGGAWWATVYGVTNSRRRLSRLTLLVIGTKIRSFNTTKDCVRVQEGREELLQGKGQERRP